MRDLPDFTVTRRLALEHAVDLHRISFEPGDDADQAVTRTATRLFQWLVGPATVAISIGPVRDQVTGQPTGNPSKGNPMQITNGEEYDLIANVSDVKGVDVPDDPGTASDDIQWTIDNPDAASLRISSDSRTCTVVGGTLGSAVWTMTMGEIFRTGAVDVVHSAAAKVEVTEGAARPQEAPPAP